MFDLSVIPVLETPRLRLRGFEERDLEGYAAMLDDPVTMRFLNGGQPVSRRHAWHSLAGHLGQWLLRGYGLFAVEEKAEGRLVGRVGIYHPETWPGPELAWTVARPYWGQGIAPEAAAAIRDWAFGARQMPRLISLIDPANTASIRVAEKLGARRDGDIEIEGKPALIYAMENPASVWRQST